jgi:hypothetical protein
MYGMGEGRSRMEGGDCSVSEKRSKGRDFINDDRSP